MGLLCNKERVLATIAPTIKAGYMPGPLVYAIRSMSFMDLDSPHSSKASFIIQMMCYQWCCPVSAGRNPVPAGVM
jgi:hypothetical protein